MDSIVNRLGQQLVLSSFIANAYDNFINEGSPVITQQQIDRYVASLNNLWTQFSRENEGILMALTRLPRDERIPLLTHSYFSESLYTDTRICYLASVEQIKSSLSLREPVVLGASLREEEPVVVRSSSRINEPSATKDSVTSEQPVLTNSVSVPSLSNKIPSTSHVMSYGSPYARLPRMDIPTFDGNPAKWLEYRDLFHSMVVSTSLTAVEMLQYLKTSLIGTAAHLIQNTTLTAENFLKAWESLVSFYDNTRLQVNTALNSLVNLKPMTKESSVELELLYTTVLQIYRTLETLQQPVETWDAIFVYSTVRRLDSESVKAWENKLGSSKIPPSWKELIEFLVTRLFSLQAYEKSRGIKFQFKSQPATAKTYYQGQSNDNSGSNKNVCPICKGKHYVMKCPKYVDETLAQKLALVTKHKLCFNCLGNHRVSHCKVVKRCQKCGKKHHTTIHKVEASSEKKDVKSEDQVQSSSAVMDTNAAKVLHSIVDSNVPASCVLLATARVFIIFDRNETRSVRALIDPRSEVSIITERVVQQLNLPRRNSSISLAGIGGQGTNKTKAVIGLEATIALMM
ncbi:Gag-pol polyprotein [Temnothorax longispinosus]|uniref:Gag-pol polyprotein n=1 Tax=Temnothorax longispinosus TaxID=300112 RepID=A0A4S2KQH3_9HYME|nr:Gag-pol polyprotein [Temnothorax longispinosus]